MRKYGIYLLAALLLCLSACGAKTAPADADAAAPVEPAASESAEPAAPAAPEPEAPEEPEPPAAEEDPIEALLSDKDALLHAARRATARAFDQNWLDGAMDSGEIEGYYHGFEAQVTDSALVQRARALAAVEIDRAHLKQEGETVLYRAALPQDGNLVDTWLELDLSEPSGPSKTVSERYVTAELENNRVFLTFEDSEEALYYLCGFAEDPDYSDEYGRAFPMPGDELPVGAAHRYEVEGLFSNYTDILLADLGDWDMEYCPCLFLTTEDGGLEYVDVVRCFRHGFFCAMPIPGLFDTDAPIEFNAGQYGFRYLEARNRQGDAVDLSWCAETARLAAPEGAWSGSMDEVTVEGGSYFRVASLDIYTNPREACGYFGVSELDVETLGGRLYWDTLGMTEDGIVSAICWDGDNGTRYSVEAWRTGVEERESGFWEVLYLKPLTRGSLLNDEEELTLYQSEFGPMGAQSGAMEPFLGEWMDTVSGRCYMTIENTGRVEEARIEITWGDSAAETYVWTMTGTPGLIESALYCEDCECKIVSYNADGSETVKEVLYSDGYAEITPLEDGLLQWYDENSENSVTCRFARLDEMG